MNRDSILFSITLFFGMAVISVIMLFYLLIQVEYDRYKAQTFNRYNIADRIFSVGILHHEARGMMAEQIKSLNFRPVTDLSRIEGIIMVSRHHTPTSELTVFKSKKRSFLKIENQGGVYILEDLEHHKKMPMRLYFSLFISLLIVIIVYIIIIRKLRPLSRLRLKVRRFGEGDMSVSTATPGSDEIAELANEFDATIHKIKNLESSRKLFLRNIMHELKTPLTKGRISTEMLEDSKNKQRLVDVFSRIDILIDQLGKIEQLISGYLSLNRGEFRFIDVLEHAMDLLMLDRTATEINNTNLLIDGDFELFSIAVKNLIDNGIKYSATKRVTINVGEGDVAFISEGKALKKSLEYYIRPFSRDQTNNKEGMGLGLYITHEILQKHGFLLTYGYYEGKNHFIIHTTPPAKKGA